MCRGRDSSVGMATRYGLDGPGIESWWGARFSAPIQTGPGAHPASYALGTGSFTGVKRPRSGVDHPPHLAPRLKEEYSYTSTPPLGLHGLFWGELHICVITHCRPSRYEYSLTWIGKDKSTLFMSVSDFHLEWQKRNMENNVYTRRSKL